MDKMFENLFNELKDVVPVSGKNKDCCENIDLDITTCMSAVKCNACGWVSREIPAETSADLY